MIPGFRAKLASKPGVIGLIACAGRFPVVVAEKAREVGVPLVCIGLKGMADPKLAEICHEFHWLNRLSLGFVSKTFLKAGVQRWTMAGKFHKRILFQPWRWLQLWPDYRLIRLWFNRNRVDNADDNLLLAIIEEFKRDGLDCVSALDLCPELLVAEGVFTKRKVSAKEEKDVQFGWGLAKQMGGLDVGQSVMVKDRAVLAVEAIEGTDKAILRAGELCGNTPFVVVKVAKPNQDMRFDVPTVGRTTIESMKAAGAKVLAIEAGKTIFIDEKETIELANRYEISIFAIPEEKVAKIG
jgi:UDP-2,3-diacylglucosamine hydrolase